MKKRNPVRRKQTQKRSGERTKYLMMAAVCGVVFIASLFFAARQHFSSIDYSIKNAKLRKQIEDLEYDKQRLRLTREISLSPFEIKKAAKKIGFSELTETASTAVPASTNAPVKNDAGKTVKASTTERPVDTAKLVQKTVQSAPVAETRKQDKKDVNVRERKVQIAAAGK